jgi:hypothetical protein
MKGKQLSSNKRPYLTLEHWAVRIAYAIQISQMQREGTYNCYFDGKFFYTTL